MYNKATDEVISKNILEYMKIYSSNWIVNNSWKIENNIFGINSLKTVQSCSRRNYYTYLSLPYKIASVFTDYILDGMKISSKDTRVNDYLEKNKEKLAIKLQSILHNCIGIWYQPVDVVGDQEENNIALYKQNLYYPDTANMYSGGDYSDIKNHRIKKIYKNEKWDINVFTKEYKGNTLTTYNTTLNQSYTKDETRLDEQVIQFEYSPFFLFSNNIVLWENSEEIYNDFFDYIGRPEIYQVLQIFWYIVDLITYTRIDIGKNWLPKLTVPAHFISWIEAQNQDDSKPISIANSEFFINWENGDKPEYITKDTAYLEQMRVAIDKMMYQVSNILDIPPNKLWLQEGGNGNITATEIKKSQEWFYKKVQSKRVWFESPIKALLQYVAYVNTGVYAEVEIEWKNLWDNIDQADTYINMVTNQMIDRRTAVKSILNIWNEEYDEIERNRIEEMKMDWSLFSDSNEWSTTTI